MALRSSVIIGEGGDQGPGFSGLLTVWPYASHFSSLSSFPHLQPSFKHGASLGTGYEQNSMVSALMEFTV